MSKRILIVEDDPHIQLGLTEALESEGYEVTACGDGGEAAARIRQIQPDLVILDVMLPHKNGYDICRELRAARNSVPVLMLTAKGQEIDKVVGLEIGADDYVTKPFGLRELIARVHALLRRASAPANAPLPPPESLHFGDVEIDGGALRGKRGETPFSLTPREFAVLTILFRERGNAISRDRLLNDVWGIEYYGTTRTLDQVIVKLRQKIEHDSANPVHILTVHGLGYRFESCGAGP